MEVVIWFLLRNPIVCLHPLEMVRKPLGNELVNTKSIPQRIWLMSPSIVQGREGSKLRPDTPVDSVPPGKG